MHKDKLNYHQIADTLDQAAQIAQPIVQISKHTGLTLPDAYIIQEYLVGKRLGRGESVVGVKLGFTSKAKMEQMGVKDMIWGILTQGMEIEDGGNLVRSQFIHPRAEPEIAFRVARNIGHELTQKEAMHYVDGVAVALEIIDSRYQNFSFSLEDVVADNCSSAGFVVGPWQKPDSAIENLKMTLSLDGTMRQQGSSQAILGNPWEAFVAATRLVSQQGKTLKIGDVVLAGAATAAEYLEGHSNVKAFAEGLGEVTLTIS